MDMQSIWTSSECMENEQHKITDEIRSTIESCMSLDISTAKLEDVYGIWTTIEGRTYLVDPIELVNSIFFDDNFCLLEDYYAEEDKYRTVYIQRERHCYSWRLNCEITKRNNRLYYSYFEYVPKIKKCLEALCDVWRSGKPVAYNKDYDFDLDNIIMAIMQLEVDCVLPSYNRKTDDSVQQEKFTFEPLKDDWNERYRIGIGKRVHDTWLTHWDNNYNCIRHELESFFYNNEAIIKLSFDMSETILKISHESVLNEVNKTENGFGFTYKDYALVEIRPNEFVHNPVIKGYCDLKQTIRTIYEGLLKLAMNHPTDKAYDGEPLQLEAYNMFKSPLIERYINGQCSGTNRSDIRQVSVKRILIITPDYDEVLTDTQGKHIDVETEEGFIDEIYDKDGKPFNVPGLLEWQKEIAEVVINSAVGKTIPFDWENYHKRGKELAHQLRKQLSQDFDLWYFPPVEDTSNRICPTLIID